MVLKKQVSNKEYSEYFGRYIGLVDENTELIKGFEQSLIDVTHFFDELSEDQMSSKYGEDKWTIKELFQHIIDTERVFMYRFLRIGRGDKTPLEGFDQDVFVGPSNANNKSKEHLIQEYKTTRLAFLSIINTMRVEDFNQIGTASNGPLSARAIVFIMIGHEIWHINIVKERYL